MLLLKLLSQQNIVLLVDFGYSVEVLLQELL